MPSYPVYLFPKVTNARERVKLPSFATLELGDGKQMGISSETAATLMHRYF